jgi:tRNA1Val (adenine37-N6)-methyltransferase
MSIFRFKQFNVDQTGCAMKVNTDGVLLGALAEGDKAVTVLDIGTGTGIIALMLAQRFPQAQIDAVELDETAAQTARLNFETSSFAGRLQIYVQSFQQYHENHSYKSYDLIVSNPPFYIQSLQSPQAGKNLAKHAGNGFFDELVKISAQQLSPDGELCLILPLTTAAMVIQIAVEYGLFVRQIIHIQSYPNSAAHRQILTFGFHQTQIEEQGLIIYNKPMVYADEYKSVLKEFLTIF